MFSILVVHSVITARGLGSSPEKLPKAMNSKLLSPPTCFEEVGSNLVIRIIIGAEFDFTAIIWVLCLV